MNIARNELNKLFKLIQQSQCNNIFLNFSAGSILCKVKRNMEKEDILSFVKTIQLSLSWC